MKKILIVLVATLVLVTAWPSQKEKSKSSRKFDDSRTEKLDSLPQGAKIPAKSTFMDKSEKTDGNIVYGQYSYIDPLGSLVVVKYTVGKDGSDYAEKRLFTVNYKSNSVIDTSPIEKIAYENKDVDLTEDELIEKIIAKLRPQIKEIVANKETAVRDTALTSPSKSVFDYFYSKVDKFEGIASQIMCEMMTSSIGDKVQKTEDELISRIIFKVIGYLPQGTLLDYAKKLSRHVRQAVVKDEVDLATTTIQPETTTDQPEEEATTTSPDIPDFGNLFGTLLASLFGDDNSTSSESTSGEKDFFTELSGLFDVIFSGSEDESEESNSEDSSVTAILKQVISHGQEGCMAQMAELLLDVESLMSLYTREAVCLNVPGHGIQKPATNDNDDDEQDTTTNLPVEEKEKPETKVTAVEDLKPVVKSVVEKLVTKSVSEGPVEDEALIEKITNELEPKIAERLRRRQSDPSDEVLTEESEEAKAKIRPDVVEAIHNQRLELYKQEQHKDWPSKTSSTD